MIGTSLKSVMMEKMKISTDGGKKSFTMQVNPSTVSVSYSVEYKNDSVPGGIVYDCKYVKTPPRNISFKVLFDATGAINCLNKGVTENIDALLGICYAYNGEKHAPNEVLIVWGKIIVTAKLTSANTEYKLFSPQGKPLRAELDLKFEEYITEDEAKALMKKSSPDMTHVVKIRAGDRLPSLCSRIYSNPMLYLEVAAANNLTDFRNIEPGMELVFPPLK